MFLAFGHMKRGSETRVELNSGRIVNATTKI